MPMQPKGFVGFPDVKMKAVKIPDFFFTDLLPMIDDLAELKLTLHCFWLLNEQESQLKYLRGVDLRNDHPISVNYTTALADRDGELRRVDAAQKWPAGTGEVLGVRTPGYRPQLPMEGTGAGGEIQHVLLHRRRLSGLLVPGFVHVHMTCGAGARSAALRLDSRHVVVDRRFHDCCATAR